MMNQCLELLKREEVQREFKLFMIPYINIVLSILKPYFLIVISLLAINTGLLTFFIYMWAKKYFLH